MNTCNYYSVTASRACIVRVNVLHIEYLDYYLAECVGKEAAVVCLRTTRRERYTCATSLASVSSLSLVSLAQSVAGVRFRSIDEIDGAAP